MKKKYIWILISLFSIFYSCKDRIFNNPFDPNPEVPGYEIISITPIGSITPVDMTFVGDSIWVVDLFSKLLSLNYNSGSIIRELDFTSTDKVNGICYNGSDLWLNIEGKRRIVKVNIINGQIIKILNLVEGHFGVMDFFNATIYISDELSNSILQIDEETGEVLNTIKNPSFYCNGICFDGENLWVLDAPAMRIYKINTNGDILNVYQSPEKNPIGLCYSEGIIWCGDRSGKIFKLRFQ